MLPVAIKIHNCAITLSFLPAAGPLLTLSAHFRYPFHSVVTAAANIQTPATYIRMLLRRPYQKIDNFQKDYPLIW